MEKKKRSLSVVRVKKKKEVEDKPLATGVAWRDEKSCVHERE